MMEQAEAVAQNEAARPAGEERSDAAFLDALRENRHSLYRLALSILRNHADAEDALGQCVENAYAKRASLRSGDSLRPWMMRILARACYDLHRRKKRVSPVEILPEIPVWDEPSYELLGTVMRLPDGYRAVVVLHYYEDMSIEQIARTLGIAAGTVKSRLFRAKERLRTMLEQEGV